MGNFMGNNIIKTNQEIKKEAVAKYNRISDKKKKQHLEKRKKSIIVCHVSWFSILSVVSLIFLIAGLVAFGVMLALLSVALFGYMFIRLKMPDKKIILEQLEFVLKKTYSSWTYEKVAKAESIVKVHSKMYKEIQEINKKYVFDRTICKKHRFNEKLSNKRQFDNFDYSKWIFAKIESLPNLFLKMETTYEWNSRKYSQYSSEYDAIEKYTPEIEIEDVGIEFEIFNACEKRMFENSKHSKIEIPSVYLEISYTSPSGRNHYQNSRTYNYKELLLMIQEKEAEEKRQFEEKAKKEALSQQKREKERKLRELDKIEKKLTQKEKELGQKEKEFFEATKEHVYTTEQKQQLDTVSVEIKEEMSLTQKMKLLRAKFDNGEITYGEYQRQRKELI